MIRRSLPCRGVTLVEILMAVAVASILIAITASVFIRVLRESSDTRAEVRATIGARLAADQIARELQQLQLDSDPDFRILRVINQTLPFGDHIDNDGDGQIDEEVFDGFDNDGDWTLESDRHAATPFGPERFDYVGVPDHGDANVDEDVRFSRDEIIFIIPAQGAQPRQRVHYRIGTFEGVDNVLLRGVVNDPPLDPPFVEAVEPVLFDVLSLDILAWNANNDAVSPTPGTAYWVDQWESSEKILPAVFPLNADDTVEPFVIPPAFLISVVTSAERVPLSDWPPLDQGVPIRTVRSTIIVSVESVINSATYNQFIRRP